MRLRSYLIGMALATAFCSFSFGLILFYVDPNESGIVGVISFYASLLFASIGTFTILGFYLRLFFSKNEIVFAHVAPAFRQAVLLALALIGSLLLQAFRLLTWWDAALLVLTLALFEFYFLSRKIGVKN
ncbi:MAG: hypothetical protein ABIE68_01295 [bacterium]